VNDQPASAAAHSLDIRGVMAALPHRYPMLLVDRVETLIPDERIVAVKAVSINEEFFQGHFPGRPIMPACFRSRLWLRPPACWRSKASA
jgi:3-hydroxyacyl-[acyl-carrier-protein] dehydratase